MLGDQPHVSPGPFCPYVSIWASLLPHEVHVRPVGSSRIRQALHDEGGCRLAATLVRTKRLDFVFDSGHHTGHVVPRTERK